MALGEDEVPVTVGPWTRDDRIVLPANAAEFAVGDVHGLANAFRALTAALAREARGAHSLTLLGDLADRGPDSLGCLRHAASLAAGSGFSAVHLLQGNHELMLLDLIRSRPSRDAAERWIANGAVSTLAELGLNGSELAVAEWLRTALAASAGEDVVAMLERAVTHREVGNVLLVHAGIHPDADLATWFAGDPFEVAAEERHYAWIRWAAIAHEAAYPGGRVVVHGHTPERAIRSWKGRPEAERDGFGLDGWRLGLDAGAPRSGRVAGAELRRRSYRVFVAGG